MDKLVLVRALLSISKWKAPYRIQAKVIMAKILVVDDEDVFRSRLMAAASGPDLDHEVMTAGTLEDAIELIRHNDFDVVLTDLGLKGGPGEEGLEVLKAAKEKDIYSQVIVITSFGTPALNSKAMDMGAYDYLPRRAPATMFQREVHEAIIRALEYRKQIMTKQR